MLWKISQEPRQWEAGVCWHSALLGLSQCKTGRKNILFPSARLLHLKRGNSQCPLLGRPMAKGAAQVHQGRRKEQARSGLPWPWAPAGQWATRRSWFSDLGWVTRLPPGAGTQAWSLHLYSVLSTAQLTVPLYCVHLSLLPGTAGQGPSQQRI